MELFDLVDKNDRVVGTTHKAEAHSQRLIHRVAAVYVFDQVGELYVQVHKSSGGLYDHSVGGHVSQGEDYPAAATREADEELGIKQPLEYVSTFFSDEGKYLHMFGVFECVAETSWQFVPNEEVEEIIPMSIGKIRALMAKQPELFTAGFRNTMREYCRIKQIA